ncbi:MAG: helix-turn-helix domain-containing protein [Treponema sp.]|nr:helix-turn-helix domain-containing protein [Treponema sp.]MCL2272089.1 helix-turn-helix domain-containing protein [Treponema sp.]
MESLGEKLRNARTEKGLSINQVSRDTNITIRYIEALESENFSVFPGEAYVIGFIKNYSSYLDLDVQKSVSLYRALKIQEQPVPAEQLFIHPRHIPKFTLPAIIILAVLCAGSYGIYRLILRNQERAALEPVVERIPVEYLMEGNSMERRLYKNDSVLIHANNEIYKVELFNLGEAITIQTPGGSVVLDLSQEASIDLNNNGTPDLRITVADFAKNNADMGALLHFLLFDSLASADDSVYGTNYSMNTISTIIIPGAPSAYPFTLQMNFHTFCMFRWEILNERDRSGTNQNYFQRAEDLSIQAQNGIRIWTSNAQASRYQIIGGGRTYPLEVGTTGEVVVADIRWVRDENNLYRLVFIRLES